MNESPHTAPRASISRSAVALGLIALASAALLTWVHSLTEPRIAEQERRQLLEQLRQVVPPGRFDNEMHEDFITVRDETFFPGGQAVKVFRARQDGRPAAVAMKLRANDGYNGRIDLLVGIFADGRVSGVRVLGHRETPGLGDAIEIERSDWIRSFEGKSLERPGSLGWAVKRDGGEFDQFTGATITPRAIVNAVHRALQFFEASRNRLFSAPSEFEPRQSEDEA